MRLAKDLREFVELLISHRVDFLVVGAHALAFHGRPRYTGDLDLWVRASEENASRTMEVLRAFGFGGLDVRSEDFVKPGRVVQLGHPPLRIDLMTGISGVEFDTAWPKRVEGELDGLKVFFLDRDSFIKNKRAAGRPQDLADVSALAETPEPLD